MSNVSVKEPVIAKVAAPVKPSVPVVEQASKKVPLLIGKIEEGLPIPASTRGSKYEFGLDEMHENQSRFIAPPEGIDVKTLLMAVRNGIDTERRAREFKQNFIMREAEQNGIKGVRVWCVSIADHPMRANNKKQQSAA